MAREPNPTPPGADSILDPSFSIRGYLSVRGNLHLEGRVEGTVEVTGRLMVGKKAKILGEARAQDSDVSGTIEGVLKVKQGVDLRPGSRLVGDVYAREFRIEEGAYFQGDCVMGDSWDEDF